MHQHPSAPQNMLEVGRLPAPITQLTGRRPRGACLQNLRAMADHFESAQWAARYLRERVMGTAPLTLMAKARDLELFLTHLTRTVGHGLLRGWTPAETRGFLNHMASVGRAPATRNRLLATLRHFARWLQAHPESPNYSQPLPTLGVPGIRLQEPTCKKLTAEELAAILAAAEEAAREKTRDRREAPRRNRAIVAVLLYTGLRVSEVLSLNLGQYQRSRLEAVQRKGGGRSAAVHLASACRTALDDYLQQERMQAEDSVASGNEPLFTTSRGTRFSRGAVYLFMQRLARKASEMTGKPIAMHPHMLRHTFGAAFRERSGSDAETAAALGHTGLGYVGRYVRKTDEQRAAVVESLFDL